MTLASLFIVSPCLPHYVLHMRPEVGWLGPVWTMMPSLQCPPSDASMKTAITLVQYMQDAELLIRDMCLFSDCDTTVRLCGVHLRWMGSDCRPKCHNVMSHISPMLLCTAYSYVAILPVQSVSWLPLHGLTWYAAVVHDYYRPKRFNPSFLEYVF